MSEYEKTVEYARTGRRPSDAELRKIKERRRADWDWMTDPRDRLWDQFDAVLGTK